MRRRTDPLPAEGSQVARVGRHVRPAGAGPITLVMLLPLPLLPSAAAGGSRAVVLPILLPHCTCIATQRPPRASGAACAMR